MSSFADRIKELRGNSSQPAFADLVGSTKQKISNYESGKIKPTFEALQLIASSLNINLNWLITGRGNKYNNEDITLVHEPTVEYNKIKAVNIYTQIAAGKPFDVWDDILYEVGIDHPATNKEKGQLFGFEVKGDSMTPRFREGDVVIAKLLNSPIEMPRNREFIVTVFKSRHGSDSQANLKLFKWIKKNEDFILSPLNTYQDITTHNVKDVRYFFKVLLTISEHHYKK